MDPRRVKAVSPMRFIAATLTALVMAVAILASTGEDILRVVCIGLGPNHPLYDILGCPLIVDPPSPEG